LLWSQQNHRQLYDNRRLLITHALAVSGEHDEWRNATTIQTLVLLLAVVAAVAVAAGAGIDDALEQKWAY
jgi:hypothetical protein